MFTRCSQELAGLGGRTWAMMEAWRGGLTSAGHLPTLETVATPQEVDMNMTEAVQEGLKALVLPELKAMATELAAVRLEQARQGGQLDATNHRLTDMHDILVLLTPAPGRAEPEGRRAPQGHGGTIPGAAQGPGSRIGRAPQ